jgi:hypothetical protein
VSFRVEEEVEKMGCVLSSTNVSRKEAVNCLLCTDPDLHDIMFISLSIDEETTVGEVAVIIARIIAKLKSESSFEGFTARWEPAIELKNSDKFKNLTGWNSPTNEHLITVNTKACGESFWADVDLHDRDGWVFVDFDDTWGDTFQLSPENHAVRISMGLTQNIVSTKFRKRLYFQLLFLMNTYAQ